MVKLIYRIPGSRHLISSLLGSALRTVVKSLGKPRDVNTRSQSLISKDSPSILYFQYMNNQRADQTVWLPSLVCAFVVCMQQLGLISNDIVSTKIYDKRDDFDFDIVNFPFLDGDVPCSTSYGVYISQLIRFARASSYVADFNTRNKLLTQKLLKQGYRYHKLRKTFSNFIDDTMI